MKTILCAPSFLLRFCAKPHRLPATVLATTCLLALSVADAYSSVVLIQPVSATTTLTTAGGPGVIASRDQTGLLDKTTLIASPYTSGVTDFNTYLTNTVHDYGGGGSGFSYMFNNPVSGSSVINYDLGSVHTLSAFALWNTSFTAARAINQFDLLLANNSDFSDAVSVLTDLTASNSVNPQDPYKFDFANSFTFSNTSARYARLVIDSNYGDPSFTAFGEVAFGAVGSVPEPSRALLLMGGVLSMALRRRRGV